MLDYFFNQHSMHAQYFGSRCEKCWPDGSKPYVQSTTETSLACKDGICSLHHKNDQTIQYSCRNSYIYIYIYIYASLQWANFLTPPVFSLVLK